MKNIHNVNIFNTSLEEVLKLALFYKDEQGRLKKKQKIIQVLKLPLSLSFISREEYLGLDQYPKTQRNRASLINDCPTKKYSLSCLLFSSFS
mgnify:CR=1 FL=1